MAVDPRKHSRVLLEGPDRAAARAMMKAVGFTDQDLARPQIGVAHCWIGTMPCNWNHRKLAEKVMQGIRAAGGTPIEVNTISITDGITMVLGRLDIPSLMLYCGSIMFGRCVGTEGPFAGRNLTIQDVFEALGAYNAGKLPLDQFKDVEDHA